MGWFYTFYKYYDNYRFPEWFSKEDGLERGGQRTAADPKPLNAEPAKP